MECRALFHGLAQGGGVLPQQIIEGLAQQCSLRDPSRLAQPAQLLRQASPDPDWYSELEL